MRPWCRPNGSRRVCSVDRERFPLRSLSLHRLPQPATRSRLPVGEASSSPRRFRPAQEVYKSGALVLALRYAERVLLLSPKGRHNWLTALLWGEGQRAVRLIKHPWELEARWRGSNMAHESLAEQAMPPGPTLARGGQTRRARATG